MWRLAYYNTVRRRRSVFAICITAITVLFFALFWSVYAIGQSGLRMSAQRMGADVLIYPKQAELDQTQILFTGAPQMVYMNLEQILPYIPMENVEAATPQFYLQTLSNAGCCSGGLDYRIVGVDFSSDFLVTPWLTQQVSAKPTEGEMFFGNKVEPFVGNLATVMNKLFHINGTLQPTGSGMDESIFINIDEAREMAINNYGARRFDYQDVNMLATSYLLKLKPKTDVDAFVQNLSASGIDANIVSVEQTRLEIQSQLNQFSSLLFLFWAALAAICGISLFALYNSSMAERKKEIGYLRSMGMKKGNVLRLILMEVILQGGIGGLIGSIVGVLLASPLLSILKDFFIIPVGIWNIPTMLLYILMGTGVSLLICLAAALWPALISARMEPYKALAEGELQ